MKYIVPHHKPTKAICFLSENIFPQHTSPNLGWPCRSPEWNSFNTSCTRKVLSVNRMLFFQVVNNHFWPRVAFWDVPTGIIEIMIWYDTNINNGIDKYCNFFYLITLHLLRWQYLLLVVIKKTLLFNVTCSEYRYVVHLKNEQGFTLISQGCRHMGIRIQPQCSGSLGVDAYIPYIPVTG